MMTPITKTPWLRARFALLFVGLAFAASLAGAAEGAKKPFDIPAGDALATLKLFIAQSGAQLLYSAEEIEGVRTQAIKGDYLPVSALEAMLFGTRLVVQQDERTGIQIVRSQPAGPPTGAKASAALSGLVSSAQTKNLLEGVMVEIPALQRQTFTERDGRFSFGDVPPGTYEVRASYTGFEPQSRTVAVAPVAGATADFALGKEILVMTEFLVQSEREGNAASITRQRNAANVKNVIALDALGVLPNDNLGELLVRVPGVAGGIDDSGEIISVQIRGAAADQSSVMIDGVRMSSGGGFARGFQINKMPGALFEEIEVTKAATPEMDADSVGGAVNLKTRSPLAMRERRRISFRVSDRWAPPFFAHPPVARDEAHNAMANLRFQGKFSVGSAEPSLGVDVSGTYGQVARPSRFVRYDYPTSLQSPVFVPTYVAHDTSSPQDKIGANVKLGYRLAERSRVFLNFLYNVTASGTYRHLGQASTGSNLVTFAANGTPTGTGTIYPDFTATVTRVRGLNASVFTITDTASPFRDVQGQIHAGGEHAWGRFKLDFEGNYSRSKTHGYDGAEGGILTRTVRSVGWILDRTDPERPVFTQTEGASVYSGASYSAGTFTRRNNSSIGEISTLSANLGYDAIMRVPLNLKTGVRYRRQYSDATVESRLWTYRGADGVVGTADDNFGLFGDRNIRVSAWGNALPFVDLAQINHHLRDNPVHWIEDPYRTETQRLQGLRQLAEDVGAAYLQGSARLGSFGVLTGARFERTDVVGSGNVQAKVLSTTAQRTANPLGAARADWDNARRIDGGYSDWFPSVHLTHRLGRGLLARASWSTGIARPPMGNLVPRETANVSGQTLTINNPSLKPQHTDNADLSLEYYFEPVGLLTVAVFRKNLRDYIVSSNAGTVGQGADNGYNGEYAGYTLLSQFNSGTARIEGVEVSYQQQFTFLPRPFDGLGVSASHTRLSTEGNYGGAETRSTSEVGGFIPETTNLSVNYRYGRFAIRYLANRNSAYLANFSTDPSSLRYKFARTGVSLNTSWQLFRGVDLFCNFDNLTDAPQRYYLYKPDRPERTIYTGTFITFGVNGTF